MIHLGVLDERGKTLFEKLAAFREEFYLAGGTALALQIGHRISVDFDLFSSRPIKKGLLPKVKRVFAPGAIRISVNNPDELTVFVDDRKITFLSYPFPPILKLLRSPYLKLLGKKELAATKAYTLGRRGSLKDYVDLYFLISEKWVTIQKILDLAEKKYADEFNGRLFLEQLIYLEDLPDEKLIFLKKPVSNRELKTFFEKEIRAIKLKTA